MQENDKSTLVSIVKLSRNITNTFEKRFGISYARIRILIILYKRTELSQTDLQTHLAIDAAAVCRQLKLLKEQKLIERKTMPQDARCVYLRLTEKGKNAATQLIEKRKKLEKEVFTGFTPEQLNSFKEVMDKLQQVFFNIQSEGK